MADQDITDGTEQIWTSQVNSAYANTIAEFLQLPLSSSNYVSSTYLSSSSADNLRMLQTDRQRKITVRTTISTAAGTQNQIADKLNEGELRNVIQGIIPPGTRENPFIVYPLTSMPTMSTITAPPAPASGSVNNLGSTSNQTNGLPQTTLIAIIVVIIVVAIAGAYVVYSMGRKKTDIRGSNIAAVYNSYTGRDDKFGVVNPVNTGFAPHIARGNQPQRYSGSAPGGRRSMGNSIELADYRASGYGDVDNNSVISENPHFASPRLSLTRKSLAEHQMRSLAQGGASTSPKYMLDKSQRSANRL